MGLFDFLKPSDTISAVSDKALKDERKAECPYCRAALKKVPGAKTKCPNCREYMYVRTRPDGVRLVVTKADADDIDEQWRIENGTQDAYLAHQERYMEEKESLRVKFGGKEPSDRDVQWSMLNKDLLITASRLQWGLYRNTRFQMGELLHKEGRLKGALGLYLGVCYLDLNGASNMPVDENGRGMTESEYCKPFDVEFKFLAPGVIDRIRRIIKKLSMDDKEVEEFFIEFARKEQRASRAPSSPEECYQEIKAEIWSI